VSYTDPPVLVALSCVATVLSRATVELLFDPLLQLLPHGQGRGPLGALLVEVVSDDMT
jgi:hypothetical protein